MTAKMISAQEAVNYGLANHVVPQDQLLSTCLDIATKIARNSSTAIAGAINAVNAGFKHGVNGFETEINEFGKCFGTPDFVEGTTAFIEKRKPAFK